MSCVVGRRLSLDPALLWLWHRLVAMAPIRPLAWESPYATGAALENAKRQKNQTNKQTKKKNKKNLVWYWGLFYRENKAEISIFSWTRQNPFISSGPPRRKGQKSEEKLMGVQSKLSRTEEFLLWYSGLRIQLQQFK